MGFAVNGSIDIGVMMGVILPEIVHNLRRLLNVGLFDKVLFLIHF